MLGARTITYYAGRVGITDKIGVTAFQPSYLSLAGTKKNVMTYTAIAPPAAMAVFSPRLTFTFNQPGICEATPPLVGAILLEQNDEWAVQRARYMGLETIAPLSDDPIIMLSAVPAA
jgi:hypothetical protein